MMMKAIIIKGNREVPLQDEKCLYSLFGKPNLDLTCCANHEQLWNVFNLGFVDTAKLSQILMESKVVNTKDNFNQSQLQAKSQGKQ